MKKLILSLLFLILFSASAYAEDYIAVLKEAPTVQLSSDSSVERVPISDEIMFKADTLEEIENFTNEENVIRVFPNCTFELFDTPNDTYYSYQWNLDAVNSLYAYEKGLRGKGVKVGIIDSGFTYGHEDVDTDKIVSRYNTFTNNQSITDDIGHGTFVTGTIAANINNSLGIAGIADEAQLCIYKIFNDKETTIEKLILALQKAIRDECDVINMSLGAAETSMTAAAIEELQYWIDKATASNIIVVAAVGNNGTSVLNYPAACDNVIGVGSVSQSLAHSSFSNYNVSVFVTAPGENLTGLGCGSSSSYSVAKSSNRGTSYSTPVVTAMAAIARQVKPDISADEFKEALKATSADLGTVGYDEYYGWGLVDIEKFADFLIYTYIEDVYLNDDKTAVIHTAVTDETTMYTAAYSDGVLIGTQKNTFSGHGEIPIVYPENSDTVKVFFWQSMKPTWNMLEILKADEE